TSIEATDNSLAVDLEHENYAADGRSDFDLRRELVDILDIEAASCEFENDRDYEPAWNEDVHNRVLKVALRPFDAARCRNMCISLSSVSEESDLIPRHVSGGALEGKMVDYAMYLEPSPAMRERIREMLHSHARMEPSTGVSSSINQTVYAPLRHRPIAVSIETKTPDGNESSAKAQLAVWAAAQLEHMRRLSPRMHLPTLPLVLISGVDWDVYYVRADEKVGEGLAGVG
ncbi:hypothetical protein MPH_13489, partial [Macrophomina phaseolina MS6]